MLADSNEDILRKFQHTYVCMDINGNEYLVELLEEIEDGYLLFSPKFGEISVDENHLRERLSVKFPKPSLFNYKQVAYCFNKVPERQWKRAPCNHNCIAIPLLNNVQFSDIGKPETFNLRMLETILSPVYPTSLDTALENMELSVAISKDFGVTASPWPAKGSHILWYRSSPVATIDPKEKQVVVKHRSLLQETLDYFRVNEPTWSVQ